MSLKSLANPRDAAELRRRLQLVRRDSARRWGRMSAHQMICHLRDAFVMGTDEKPVSHVTGLRHRTIVKWLALYFPARWPAGIRTRPEVDQMIGGTRPGDFPADVAALENMMNTLTSTAGFFDGRSHPIFGALSEGQWMRWAYLHVDHHLRQFGV